MLRAGVSVSASMLFCHNKAVIIPSCDGGEYDRAVISELGLVIAVSNSSTRAGDCYVELLAHRS